MNSAIPLAVLEAIERGSCQVLPTRDGWSVWTEVTMCPRCRAMRSLFVLRQVMKGSRLYSECGCHECDAKVEMGLVEATGRMFRALEGEHHDHC